jgi:predicted kinase
VPSIEILRGYSASGKSTYARESGKFLVSRDLIRQQFTGSTDKTVLTPEQEQKITVLETDQVISAIAAGLDVVIDDTNLVLKHARRWADLAVNLGVPWSVRDFQPDVRSLATWNERRGRGAIPYEVIESQVKRFPYKQWLEVTPSVEVLPTWEPYVPDTYLPQAYVFDIDGTLAELAEGYSPYDPNHYPHDTVIRHTAHIFGVLAENHHVVLLSGRSEEHREVTENWLWDTLYWAGELYMRPEDDRRNDAIVKSELFDKHLKYRYNVRGVFDDRDRVVAMWRARNIPCFQVNYGDF